MAKHQIVEDLRNNLYGRIITAFLTPFIRMYGKFNRTVADVSQINATKCQEAYTYYIEKAFSQMALEDICYENNESSDNIFELHKHYGKISLNLDAFEDLGKAVSWLRVSSRKSSDELFEIVIPLARDSFDKEKFTRETVLGTVLGLFSELSAEVNVKWEKGHLSAIIMCVEKVLDYVDSFCISVEKILNEPFPPEGLADPKYQILLDIMDGLTVDSLGSIPFISDFTGYLVNWFKMPDELRAAYKEDATIMSVAHF